MTRTILTAIEFQASVKVNLMNMGLQEVLYVDDGQIMNAYDMWLSKKFTSEYRSYVAMLLTLPDGIEFVDTHQYMFKVARKIGHELVIQLAEAYYYENNMSVIGEKLMNMPYDDPKHIKDEDILYFLDIVDAVYKRTNEDYFSGDSDEYLSLIHI